MKKIFELSVVTLALMALVVQAQELPGTVISDITVAQQSDSQLVDITYVLSGEAAIITLAIEDDEVLLDEALVVDLEGDVNKLVYPDDNPKLITWNAGRNWGNNFSEKVKARITAWSPNSPPDVMVIDLYNVIDGDKSPVYYYTSTNALPYGGIKSYMYKYNMMAFQKINRGTFKLQGSKDTELTEDFYAAIYQVTQGQWHLVTGITPSGSATPESVRAYRPVTRSLYNQIRGATNDVPKVDWPETGTNVTATSFIGVLRARSGVQTLDLPTDAQWEYACRAGTTTVFNDGNPDAKTGGDYNTSNIWVAQLGRYSGNNSGGATPVEVDSPLSSTAIVGSYKPNNWGLYDMHGNVWEYCLDWYHESGTAGYSAYGGVDPKGPPEEWKSGWRVTRGGGYNNTAYYHTSARRFRNVVDKEEVHVGFRMFCNIPLVLSELQPAPVVPEE